MIIWVLQNLLLEGWDKMLLGIVGILVGKINTSAISIAVVHHHVHEIVMPLPVSTRKFIKNCRDQLCPASEVKQRNRRQRDVYK